MALILTKLAKFLIFVEEGTTQFESSKSSNDCVFVEKFEFWSEISYKNKRMKSKWIWFLSFTFNFVDKSALKLVPNDYLLVPLLVEQVEMLQWLVS